MPLRKGKKNIGKNIRELKAAGWSKPKQRIAIALRVARKSRKRKRKTTKK
jgi:hypothetical protein